MQFKQGDIVIVPFPFTDLSNSKPRPAVIVSNEKVHRNGGDIILAQITSKEIRGELGFTFSNNDLTIPLKPPYTGGTVYCKKLATIDNSIVKQKISELTNNRLSELLSIIKSLFEPDDK
jgi:mRNA interferase MazF